jgi:hypothetical protein
MVMPLTIFHELECLYRCTLWDFLAVMHVRLNDLSLLLFLLIIASGTDDTINHTNIVLI